MSFSGTKERGAFGGSHGGAELHGSVSLKVGRSERPGQNPCPSASELLAVVGR